MKQTGIFNTANGLDKNGFGGAASAFYNLEAPMLYEESIRRGESVVMPGGAINAETGIHTGRSPKDKFTVRDATTEAKVWWGNNNSITSEQFDALYAEGESAPKMMSIGMHCRLLGRPGRIASLARFIDYVQGHERVWICRREEIARHWIAQHPPQDA